MKTEDLQNSILVGLETAKTLTEILNNALAGACTLEKMCEGVAPEDPDEFCGAISAASDSLADAAKVLTKAIQIAIPSWNYK